MVCIGTSLHRQLPYTSFSSIMTQVRIHGGIQPEPSVNPLGSALRISLVLRVYLIVYPSSHYNTDTVQFLYLGFFSQGVIFMPTLKKKIKIVKFITQSRQTLFYSNQNHSNYLNKSSHECISSFRYFSGCVAYSGFWNLV